MSGREAAEPPFCFAGEAREEFASGEATSEIQPDFSPILSLLRYSRSRHRKTKALAHEILPATQANLRVGHGSVRT